MVHSFCDLCTSVVVQLGSDVDKAILDVTDYGKMALVSCLSKFHNRI